MYIPLDITSSVCKVVLVSGAFYDEVFVILSAILWPIRSPFTFAGFWIALSEGILSTSVAALVTSYF